MLKQCTKDLVFSTYVEVILMAKHDKLNLTSFLHVCGGDPDINKIRKDVLKFSPRMWR